MNTPMIPGPVLDPLAQAMRDEDAIADALSDLAGLDTFDTNLPHHPRMAEGERLAMTKILIVGNVQRGSRLRALLEATSHNIEVQVEHPGATGRMVSGCWIDEAVESTERRFWLEALGPQGRREAQWKQERRGRGRR